MGNPYPNKHPSNYSYDYSQDIYVDNQSGRAITRVDREYDYLETHRICNGMSSIMYNPCKKTQVNIISSDCDEYRVTINDKVRNKKLLLTKFKKYI